VAFKVLPDTFSHDPGRVARFQREAELLATLNHPNIAAVYGVELGDLSTGSEPVTVTGIVMELVEGSTLADLIARGPIAVADALPLARQIAEALEAAHEKGSSIAISACNIKVREDGTVKVLDFGLAKATDATGGPPFDLMNSRRSSPAMMTGVGVIIGTAAYMSPGRPRAGLPTSAATSGRSAAVLYEMLTGTRAFKGEDVMDVSRGSWSGIRTSTRSRMPPAGHPAIVRRSLEKDRKRPARISASRRWRSTGVDDACGAGCRAGSQARRVDWRVRIGGAVLALAVAATAATLYVRRSASEPVVTRLEISTPGAGLPFQFALSPDGRRLAYITGAQQQLAVRSLDQVGVQILAGTEGASAPFWAPDSRTIGFITNGKVKRVDLSGGAPK
jgi:serine/threonine-protein kinase